VVAEPLGEILGLRTSSRSRYFHNATINFRDCRSAADVCSRGRNGADTKGSVRFPAGNVAIPRRSRSTWTACGGCPPG
jgi:hypothetical protein